MICEKRLDDEKNKAKKLPFSFIEWYSGMERQKILSAYERWKQEHMRTSDSNQLPTTSVNSQDAVILISNWYKELSLLELQMKSLQEDILINLVERRGDVKDLETFDMKLTAMRNRLQRAFEELKKQNLIWKTKLQ